MEKQVELKLDTMSGGALEVDFQEALRNVLPKLGDGEKGTITITIDVQRSKGTSTAAVVSYKLRYKTPDKAKGDICYFDSDYNCRVEAAPEPVDKVRQLKIAEGGDVE
ncbi:hypothetical protein [Phosphitispora fastidiosa]|uniref:hypothetical protein n=1 Tax=Phosphitispora fastidiosa TaxID=2837202 RepID=UPI001E4BB331|nr:hypothetical protein [Phosphitispora fastidiosa]MBU7006338.1 hypothetical protein [Phosphitispora fastidiosa]